MCTYYVHATRTNVYRNVYHNKAPIRTFVHLQVKTFLEQLDDGIPKRYRMTERCDKWQILFFPPPPLCTKRLRRPLQRRLTPGTSRRPGAASCACSTEQVDECGTLPKSNEISRLYLFDFAPDVYEHSLLFLSGNTSPLATPVQGLAS